MLKQPFGIKDLFALMPIFLKKLAFFVLAICPFFVRADWSSPVNISLTNSDQLRVATDFSGNAIAVWQAYDGYNYIIQAANMSAAGNWSMPINLSLSGQDANQPQIAIDYQGDAVAIWSRFNGEHSIIQAAICPFGGNWTAPINLSQEGQNAYNPSLAVSSNPGSSGDVFLIWHRFNGQKFIVQSASLPYASVWTAPVDLSDEAADGLMPEIVIDEIGNAMATWTQLNGSAFIIRSSNKLVGQPWVSDLTVPGYYMSKDAIGINLKNGIETIWSEFDGAQYILKSAKCDAQGVWSPSINMATSQMPLIPFLRINAQGSSIAMWSIFDGLNYITQVVTAEIEQNWSVPTNLSTNPYKMGSSYALVDANGNRAAIWNAHLENYSIIQMAYLPKGGQWSSPMTLSANGQDALHPVISAGANGSLIAAWLEFNGQYYVVKGSNWKAI
jgi:hypothetical protein